MDLWTYLKALVRWWWILVLVPLSAFLLATLVLFPSAPWQSTWSTLVTFEGNPQKASSFNYVDFIVLDDMEHLLRSDVVGDLVYLNLPQGITDRFSRDDIGAMFSSHRHARFVQIWVTGDDPALVEIVANTTEGILAEAVNQYLVPPDNPNFPGQVETLNKVTEPMQLGRERYLNIAAVTAAGGATAFCLIAAAEWLRVSYKAKYGAR